MLFCIYSLFLGNRYLKCGLCSTLHFTLHHITLPYLTLPYLTLPYLTLPYLALNCITLHYITLHYITLHYITLHYTVKKLFNVWLQRDFSLNGKITIARMLS